MKKHLKSQKGSTLVIILAAFVGILGAVALVSDVGLAYVHKQKLSNAVDATALAGAQELQYGSEQAISTARLYAEKNGIDPDEVNISVSSGGKSIEVDGRNTFDFFFARIFGVNSTQINSKARVVVAPVTGLKGLRPLAVQQFPFVFGEKYVLKEGADSSYHGNFGPIALGGTGASNYRNNLENSYNGMLRVGDWIPTETGNMAGPTKNGISYLLNGCTHAPKCTITSYNPQCTRLIVIPIVNTLQADGRGMIQITGFAQFILEGADNAGGHSEVTGWFVKKLAVGESDINAVDFGLHSVKLVQ